MERTQEVRPVRCCVWRPLQPHPFPFIVAVRRYSIPSPHVLSDSAVHRKTASYPLLLPWKGWDSSPPRAPLLLTTQPHDRCSLCTVRDPRPRPLCRHATHSHRELQGAKSEGAPVPCWGRWPPAGGMGRGRQCGRQRLTLGPWVGARRSLPACCVPRVPRMAFGANQTAGNQ